MGVMGLDPVLLLPFPPTELCIPADVDADVEGGEDAHAKVDAHATEYPHPYRQ